MNNTIRTRQQILRARALQKKKPMPVHKPTLKTVARACAVALGYECAGLTWGAK